MRMLKLFFLEKTGLVDSNDIKSRSLRESVFEKKVSFKYVVKNDWWTTCSSRTWDLWIGSLWKKKAINYGNSIGVP